MSYTGDMEGCHARGRTTDNGQQNMKIELEFWKQNSQFFQSDDMINSTKNDIDINDIHYSLNYFETHLTHFNSNNLINSLNSPNSLKSF